VAPGKASTKEGAEGGPFRAILFDATGTLIELAEDVGTTYARLAAAHGVTLPAWRLGDAFRRVLQNAPARVFPGRAPDAVAAAERAWWREVVRQTVQAADSTVRPHHFGDFDAFFGALYDAYAQGSAWRAVPGARAALQALRALGYRTGVVSNFDHRLPDILQAIEINTLLDVVICPQHCGAAKPDPIIFRAATTALALAPEACIYVGHDPDDDIAGARTAGLVPLALEAGCSLDDLPARIEAIANLQG
jgi:putative hydrolase of the HAD superfamily